MHNSWTSARIFKTALLLAVLICCTTASAQEYNNWLLNDGSILNFSTSPATLIPKNDEENIPTRYYTISPIALSDDQGKMLLYGHLETTAKNYVNVSSMNLE